MGRVLDGVGIPGFLQNLPEFYDRADAERSAWQAFTELWWETHRDRDVTTGGLVGLLQGEAAQKRGIDFNLKGNTERGPRTSWGTKLAKQRDRIIGRYQVAGVGKAGDAQVWRLVPVQGA